MKAFFLCAAAVTVIVAAPVISAETTDKLPPAAEKLPPPATTVYRQVLPDGRVIYSDEPVKGSKIDHTIKVEPAIKGNLWTTESGTKPVTTVPKSESTPIKKVTAPPANRKSLEQAEADVVKAEMALEDARKKQQAGVEPEGGERSGTASGGSRLNDAYNVRQKWLAKEVAQAEEKLKNAVKQRDDATR
jgi:hypothetical protein